MTISAFDLFKIGIGPSSSHTVGPMRAAGMFVASLAADGAMDKVAGIRVELFGSLGATGHGHGSVKAVVLGLTGAEPETVDPAAAGPLVDRVRETGLLRLPAGPAGPIDPAGPAGRDPSTQRAQRAPSTQRAQRAPSTQRPPSTRLAGTSRSTWTRTSSCTAASGCRSTPTGCASLPRTTRAARSVNATTTRSAEARARRGQGRHLGDRAGCHAGAVSVPDRGRTARAHREHRAADQRRDNGQRTGPPR